MLAPARALPRIIVKMTGAHVDRPGLRKNKHLGGPFVLYDADDDAGAKGAIKQINDDKKNGKSRCQPAALPMVDLHALAVPAGHTRFFLRLCT